MIDDLTLIFTAIPVFFWFMGHFRGRDRNFRKVFILFYIYLIAMIYVTILPVPILHFGLINPQALAQINWNPFQYNLWDNSLLNILLTLPLGFLAPLLARRYNWKRSLRLAIFIGLMIEFTQLFLKFFIYDYTRVVDTADIIYNFIGVMVGYFLFRMVLRWLKKRISMDKVRPNSLLDYILRR